MTDNKMISSGDRVDGVLIEEKPKDFQSLWLRFKSSPNRITWG